MVITVHKYDETLRKQQIEETIETLKKRTSLFLKKLNEFLSVFIVTPNHPCLLPVALPVSLL